MNASQLTEKMAFLDDPVVESVATLKKFTIYYEGGSRSCEAPSGQIAVDAFRHTFRRLTFRAIEEVDRENQGDRVFRVVWFFSRLTRSIEIPRLGVSTSRGIQGVNLEVPLHPV